MGFRRVRFRSDGNAEPVALADGNLGAGHPAIVGPDGRVRILAADQSDARRLRGQIAMRVLTPGGAGREWEHAQRRDGAAREQQAPSAERPGQWIWNHFAPQAGPAGTRGVSPVGRSEEHTSELQSLMRLSYDVFCLKQKNTKNTHIYNTT